MKHKTKEEQKQIEDTLLSKKGMVYSVEKTVFIQGKVPIHLMVEADSEEEAKEKAKEMGFADYKQQQTNPRYATGVSTSFNLVGMDHWDVDEDDYNEEELDEWEVETLSGHSVAHQFGWMNASEFLRAQHVMETQNHTGEWIVDVLLCNGHSDKREVFQVSYLEFGLDHPTLTPEDRALSPYFRGNPVGGAYDKTGCRSGNHYDILNDSGLGDLFWDTFPGFRERYKGSSNLRPNGKPGSYYDVGWMLFRIRRGKIDGIQSQVLPLFPSECWDFWKENWMDEEE